MSEHPETPLERLVLSLLVILLLVAITWAYAADLHADGDCRRYSEHPDTCITHQHQPPNGRNSPWENM